MAEHDQKKLGKDDPKPEKAIGVPLYRLTAILTLALRMRLFNQASCVFSTKEN